VNAKYGNDPGVTFYTHVSDQYAPFHTKVINATVRDATLGALIGGSIQNKLIEQQFAETLRLAASIQQGTVTASLILRKLGATPGKTALLDWSSEPCASGFTSGSATGKYLKLFPFS
jgi:TnpA family transposase